MNVGHVHKIIIKRAFFYEITDLFNKFKDRNGRFMDSLSKDATGLLSLYEASHLGMNSDDGLKEAKNFSIKHLVSLAGKLDNNLAEQVKQSLQTPLYWRMPRLEARKFIDLYVVDNEMSLILSKLAKLDYNLVQSIHQCNAPKSPLDDITI